MSKTVLSDPKLTSPVSYSIFQTEKLFHFQYFGRLDEKRAAAKPDWLINFAKELKVKKLNNFSNFCSVQTLYELVLRRLNIIQMLQKSRTFN